MLTRQPPPNTKPLPIYRFEVTSSLKNRSQSLSRQLLAAGIEKTYELKIYNLYFIEGELTLENINKVAQSLLCDPVTDHYTWKILHTVEQPNNSEKNTIEVALKPGVTDNIANELLKAAQRLGIQGVDSVSTAVRYFFETPVSVEELEFIAETLLVNATIQRYTLGEITPEFVHPDGEKNQAEIIPIRSLDISALEAISQERRLALNKDEMAAVQAYFDKQEREPTDAELETIAQTWSEHCVHKTLRAKIDLVPGGETINSIIRTYLQAATQTINAPWVRSAFVDNAGVIEFDEQYDLSFKVETHNHPSAIEPFGGANTGVGGVVRDILGVSHRPIANTDVLCFGPLTQRNEELPPGVLHPRRIQEGVVSGIEDYGNKLGLPTVNGAVLYHPGYTANPLVYCGCVGIGPCNAHPRQPRPDDRVIVLGGRTGRDGIRGATFSSLTMDAETGKVAGASVQIGDPITEKGLLEVVELARDQKLYTAITDCGAGGLSSAVGEMSAELGVQVNLDQVPLKYTGLDPWEIWLSEAQERVVLAVPVENIPELQQICDTYWVTLTDIGVFCDSGRLAVFYDEIPVVDLDNQFLHHGLPQHHLQAELEMPEPYLYQTGSETPIPQDETTLLKALIEHPDIASKEDIIHLYDHEVRGSSVVRPLVGVGMDGPSDAAVLKPQNTDGWKGFSLANGINPFIGEYDAYDMTFSVMDEAIRNAVAVGTDPQRIAVLDNFCWGAPSRPSTLGSLVRAAQGCHDAALQYGTPFISGKDSLNNEYLGSDGERHAIPGTLLISAIGIVPDIRNAVTMDLKSPGDLVYLIGAWQAALAGSHALMITGGRQQIAGTWHNTFFGDHAALGETPGKSVPAPLVYQAYHAATQKIPVQAAHDLSEGGLAVAAAEMCMAGRIGMTLDVSMLDPNPAVALFAETNGCLLVSIKTEDADRFERFFTDLPCMKIGSVSDTKILEFNHKGNKIVVMNVDDIVDYFKTSWKEA